MGLAEFIEPLAGDWEGVNRLQLMPDDEYTESVAPQNGLALIQGRPDDLSAVWMDRAQESPRT